MDLKVDALASATKAVESDLAAVDEAAQALKRALANLTLRGLEQAARMGVHASVTGRVFHYLGKAEAHSSGVIRGCWTGLHHLGSTSPMA